MRCTLTTWWADISFLLIFTTCNAFGSHKALVSYDKPQIVHQDKHEENHQPKMHGGLVIKYNANQRYATNAVTSFIFREIANKHQLPVQV